jgi:hypothetical protein
VAALNWTPQNETAKTEAQASITKKVQFLRDLAPDSGAYVNEVLPLDFYPFRAAGRNGNRPMLLSPLGKQLSGVPTRRVH